MSNALLAFWLSIAALGGLISITSINIFSFLYVLLPAMTAIAAYFSYRNIKQRKSFVMLAALNFLVGLILRWTPHVANGGLSVLGLFIMFLVFVPSAIFLYKLFKVNYRIELSNKNSS